MSYRKDMDELDTGTLVAELARRGQCAIDGECDYCGGVIVAFNPRTGREHKTDSCKEIARHVKRKPSAIELVAILQVENDDRGDKIDQLLEAANG